MSKEPKPAVKQPATQPDLRLAEIYSRLQILDKRIGRDRTERAELVAERNKLEEGAR